MRCESCSKMVSQEAMDPEVDDAEYSEGQLVASVHIGQNCAECGSLLKEYHFDVDESVEDFHKHSYKGEHEAEVTYNVENTEKTEGKGRYAKRFYGASVIFDIKCSCEGEAQVIWEDYVQASSMDEA